METHNTYNAHTYTQHLHTTLTLTILLDLLSDMNFQLRPLILSPLLVLNKYQLYSKTESK